MQQMTSQQQDGNQGVLKLQPVTNMNEQKNVVQQPNVLNNNQTSQQQLKIVQPEQMVAMQTAEQNDAVEDIVKVEPLDLNNVDAIPMQDADSNVKFVAPKPLLTDEQLGKKTIVTTLSLINLIFNALNI